ncbi:MAG: diacylglycerol kinase family protein [Planctomycetota bacterium]
MASAVLVLGNPYSGTRSNPKRVGRLERALAERGVACRVEWDREDWGEALRSVGEDPEAVVLAAGGDGTVADVINAMRDAGRLGLKFATLPAGNENLFAQAFGFTRPAAAIAEAVVRGQTRAVDLGQIQREDRPGDAPRLFTLMASAGFDAAVIDRLDRWRKKTRGGGLKRVNRVRYLPRIVGTLLGYRFPGVVLEADGRRVEGHQVYVCNLPQYGGGLRFAPDARPDDGELDWVVYQRRGFLGLLWFHGKVIRGKHLGMGRVIHGRSAGVALRAADDEVAVERGLGLPLQADGDVAGPAPLRVEAVPGALNLIRM